MGIKEINGKINKWPKSSKVKKDPNAVTEILSRN